MKNLQYALLLGIIGFSLSNTTQTGERVTGTARERREQRKRLRQSVQPRPQSQQVAPTPQRRVFQSQHKNLTTLSAQLKERGILQQYQNKYKEALPIVISLEKEVNILNRLLYGVLTEGSSQPIRTIDIARFVNQEWPYTAEPLRQPYSLDKLTQKQRQLSKLRENLKDQIIELSKEQHMPLLQQRFQQ